jgi:dephospho-CoA kinase
VPLPISNTTSNPKVYIDLIGQAGAGKTTIAEYLGVNYNFSLFRPSDVVRAYAKQQGIVLKSRQDYITCHRKMYDANPEVITEAVIGMDSDRVCLDGLRAPIEARVLRERCNMITIALTAPSQLRFERVMAERTKRKNRDASSITTFESFIADEKADNISTDPRDPNVNTILKMADFIIDTSPSIRKVWSEVDQIVNSIINKNHP